MMQVLLVDDERSLLDLAKIFLEKNAGFSVDAVESAREALELMKSSAYDAVVSDYQMPEMNGIDFLRSVRNSGSDIPFIIFTGKGRDSVVIEALDAGADFYLQKGGDAKAQFTELSGMIRHAVRMKTAEKERLIAHQQFMNITEFLPDATLVVEGGGKVTVWNSGMQEMTGISRDQALGKDHGIYSEAIYGEKRPVFMDLIQNEDENAESGYENIRRDEGTVCGEARLPLIFDGKGGHVWGKASLLYDADGNHIGAIESIRDITELKEYETYFLEALREKNIIIKEIHHRVRNNLQVISALIQLQQSWSEDENLKKELEELNNRIFTMATVYEMIFASRDVNYSHINVKNLVDTLISGFAFLKPVSYELSFDEEIFDEYFDLDTAVSMSLILNELLTYIIRHSYSRKKESVIRILMEREGEGMVKLELSSDDLETFEDFKISGSKELGIRLLSLIVEKNLKGNIEMTPDPGMRFIIRFPYNISDFAFSGARLGSVSE
jgi:PAS domain S-box-containing protein